MNIVRNQLFSQPMCLWPSETGANLGYSMIQALRMMNSNKNQVTLVVLIKILKVMNENCQKFLEFMSFF